MDIEGAEVDALKGASELLQNGGTTFLIELHGSDCEEDVYRILNGGGYTLFDPNGFQLGKDKKLPLHVLAKKA